MAKKHKKTAQPKKRRHWLLPICYMLIAFVYLGLCLFGLLRQNAWVKGGAQQALRLTLADFTLESIIANEDGFVTTDDDPQMIYKRADGAAFAPGIVAFMAQPNRPTGEIVLYYETAPNQGYSDKRRVWATGGGEEGWQFDLTGKKVYSLRLDPDSVQMGVVWNFETVAIGGQKAPARFFLPSAFEALLLLTMPILLWAALREGFASLDYAFTAHMLKHRRKKQIKQQNVEK